MASTKNQKAQPVRSNEYTPKAGPKKPGFKHRKAGTVARRTEAPLFDRVRQDRMAEQAEQRELREARRLERREAAEIIEIKKDFVGHQADLALKILIADNNAIRVVAEQVIANFRVAQPDQNISRMGAAMIQLDQTLDAKMLKNKNAMARGKAVARIALEDAQHKLNDKVEASRQLINA